MEIFTKPGDENIHAATEEVIIFTPDILQDLLFSELFSTDFLTVWISGVNVWQIG